MVFFTNSTVHMLAHGAWAQVFTFGAATERALVRGQLHSNWWRLGMASAFIVSGTAFLVHEQNAWFFQRSSFMHHLLGWTLLVGAVFPLIRCVRPRSQVAMAGFALILVVGSIMLYSDRDVAPIFGRISPLAGTPHR